MQQTRNHRFHPISLRTTLKNIHSDSSIDPFTFKQPLSKTEFLSNPPLLGRNNPFENYKEYLTVQNSVQSMVEFFNSHFRSEWFRYKYDPAFKRHLYLKKIISLPQKLSSFCEKYYTFLQREFSIPENVLETFVCIPGLPLETSREDILNLFTTDKKDAEEKTVYEASTSRFRELILSEPLRQTKMKRLGWAVFETKESAERAVQALNGWKLNERFSVVLLPPKTSQRKPKVTGRSFDRELRMRFDLLVAVKVVYAIVENKCEFGHFSNCFQKFLSSCGGSGFGDKGLKETVDFVVHLLRDVFDFCYFCGRFFLTREEMFARCGRVHLRTMDLGSGSGDEKGREEAMGWKLHKEEVELILNPEKVLGSSFEQLFGFAKNLLSPASLEKEGNGVKTVSNVASSVNASTNTNNNMERGRSKDYWTEKGNPVLVQLNSLFEEQEEIMLNTRLFSQLDYEANSKPQPSEEERLLRKRILFPSPPSSEEKRKEVGSDISIDIEKGKEKEKEKEEGTDTPSKGDLAKFVLLLGARRRRTTLVRHFKEVRGSYVSEKIANFVFDEKFFVFSCLLCRKKFKGKEFIEKHLQKKHKEELKEILMEIYFREFLMNYLKDDNKVTSEDFTVSHNSHFVPSYGSAKFGRRFNNGRNFSGRSDRGGERSESGESEDAYEIEEEGKKEKGRGEQKWRKGKKMVKGNEEGSILKELAKLKELDIDLVSFSKFLSAFKKDYSKDQEKEVSGANLTSPVTSSVNEEGEEGSIGLGLSGGESPNSDPKISKDASLGLKSIQQSNDVLLGDISKSTNPVTISNQAIEGNTPSISVVLPPHTSENNTHISFDRVNETDTLNPTMEKEKGESEFLNPPLSVSQTSSFSDTNNIHNLALTHSETIPISTLVSNSAPNSNTISNPSNTLSVTSSDVISVPSISASTHHNSRNDINEINEMHSNTISNKLEAESLNIRYEGETKVDSGASCPTDNHNSVVVDKGLVENKNISISSNFNEDFCKPENQEGDFASTKINNNSYNFSNTKTIVKSNAKTGTNTKTKSKSKTKVDKVKKNKGKNDKK